jgi:hypothetical protein
LLAKIKQGPKANPQTPLISLDVIRTRLLLRMSPRDARAIVRRLADSEPPSHNSQILAIFTIVRDELQFDWSYREVGSVCAIGKGIVHRVRSEAIRVIEHDTGKTIFGNVLFFQNRNLKFELS